MPLSKTITTRVGGDQVSPWVPLDRPVDIKHVGKALEELHELSEAIARCGKVLARCLIQGVGECDPVSGVKNKNALEEEMADAQANFDLVIEHFQLDRTLMAVRKQRKIERLRTWHQMLP